MNEKQRKTFANIFNDIDKNKDSKVDMQELKQQLFPLVSKKQLKNLLQVRANRWLFLSSTVNVLLLLF